MLSSTHLKVCLDVLWDDVLRFGLVLTVDDIHMQTPLLQSKHLVTNPVSVLPQSDRNAKLLQTAGKIYSQLCYQLIGKKHKGQTDISVHCLRNHLGSVGSLTYCWGLCRCAAPGSHTAVSCRWALGLCIIHPSYTECNQSLQSLPI